MIIKMIAVGLGGFLGATLRYGINEALPPQTGFPLATLCVNLAGCFALALFATNMRLGKIEHLQLAVGTGLLGAFTTFSTFSTETLSLLQNHQLGAALLYILLSVCGGIGLAYIGFQRGKGNRPQQPKVNR
ncbi:hypothetical protein BEP19_08775 [Ammoniphilus oxalaticus]|uniref:Fluoride-specific ion channel FluC n=1 Tax=Ammoniphilus oxalaticus TaxID=66863 RepID=A0A419SKA8_9BACL|nr:fluoride efflux transporter CrcB [Ammoniphilus oxalaticus]RKD24471.1 hypothetical protein BEP19_08775 [Ammoniphilus oxalaticus]